LAVFQTRPGVSHRLVAVLVAVPEPPAPEPAEKPTPCQIAADELPQVGQ